MSLAPPEMKISSTKAWTIEKKTLSTCNYASLRYTSFSRCPDTAQLPAELLLQHQHMPLAFPRSMPAAVRKGVHFLPPHMSTSGKRGGGLGHREGR